MPKRHSRQHVRQRQRKKRAARNRRRLAAVVIILLLLAAAAAGLFLFFRYRTFSRYNVTSTIEMSNSEENTEYYSYGNGYLKCAGDGLTYFNNEGILWSENYSILQPIIDICGEYIAVADMGQRNVWLYDRSGYINRINLSHNITDIEISQAGMIAVASNEGNMNYIEIRDRKGNEIMTEKSIFSSRGFLMDLSLSDDGERLAAVFVSIDKGTMKSKVIFYDLSGDGGQSDIIAGTFDQYESVLLTTVRFMDKDTVCAVGDAALLMFKFEEEPEIVYENPEMDWEIQTLFFNERYVGMVAEENGSENKYVVKVFDYAGRKKLDLGVDFAFNRADFAGEHVVLYNNHECLLYSLAGVEKLYYNFDQHIEALKSKDGRNFVYGTNARTEFITLK